jgi:hypothetical protein
MLRVNISPPLPWLVTPRSRPATHAKPNATKPRNHAKKPGIATRSAGVQVSSDSIQGEEYLSQRPSVEIATATKTLHAPVLEERPASRINATPGSATLGLQRHLIEASFRVGKMPSFPPR